MSYEQDHRSIGQALDLFHFQEEAPGMVFWHPRGWALYRLVEARLRAQIEADGYREVRTPQVLDERIWQKSGHWSHFRPNMMCIAGRDDDEPGAALKPVNCPGHIQIFERMAPSYRDLPLRLAEFGCCHRAEARGALLGLMRLRQFTQDDGHVFCEERHVPAEVERFCSALAALYRSFGFAEMNIALATRPPDRAGSDEQWDRAEALLAEAGRASGLAFELRGGEGAFYGPKLEFALRDSRGRSWQCGTIQLDFVLPERFDLRYVAASGLPERPVMLHRALLGSVERFLGILLEHHGRALPVWLAPDQVLVLPVGQAHGGYADEFARELIAAGVRARVDGDAETVSRRILRAHELGVPFVAVVGAREVAARAVALRARDGQQESVPWAEAVARLVRAGEVPRS